MRKISEQDINAEIGRLQERLEAISEVEMQAVKAGGLIADGLYEAERDRIIAQTEECLAAWIALYEDRGGST
ncbi:MAG: hypothetical protein VX874_11650 [Pseudomonadota bacterium]|nr:hypothetical protein [Pseudomonadota bacterium]